VATALFVACAFPPSASWAAAVRVPGTSVILSPPPGFSPADRYPGFQRADNGASIIVTELPGPVAEMQKGMTKELLASRGMTLIQSQTVKIGGRDALLVYVSQSAGGMDFLKWMLFAGDAKETVMIVGTFPKAAGDLSLPIKQALLSASWSAAAKVPPYEGLGFRVDPVPGLKLAGRVGNMLVFSERGTMGPNDSEQAILVVGGSVSGASIGDVEEFARDRAARTSQVNQLRNVTGRDRVVDGLRGYELVAEANDVKTGRPVRMYQLVLLDGGTYYLAQGFVNAARPPDVVGKFRNVTETFRLVSAHKSGGAAGHKAGP